jgi:choline transport protein
VPEVLELSCRYVLSSKLVNEVKQLANTNKGWINVTAWQANVSAGCFLAGGLIQALIQLNAPDHVPQAWQTLLLFYVCIFFAVCINAFARKAMPALEALILVIHVLGFFAILIPLVYLAPIKTSSKDVFTLFLNDGVFGTKGLAIMVGLVGPVYSFLGQYLRSSIREGSC